VQQGKKVNTKEVEQACLAECSKVEGLMACQGSAEEESRGCYAFTKPVEFSAEGSADSSDTATDGEAMPSFCAKIDPSDTDDPANLKTDADPLAGADGIVVATEITSEVGYNSLKGIKSSKNLHLGISRRKFLWRNCMEF
jgi:hypothetical protein